MPRKSAAALGVIPAVSVPREPPPAYLPPDEAAEWRKTVEGLPRDWIPPGAYVLLEVFCCSVVAMRSHRALMLAEPEGSPCYVEASKLYRAEAATVLRLAKTLRLGPRHDRTKLRAVPGSGLPKPWELGGGGGAPAVKNTFRGWGSTTAKEDEPPPDDPPAA